MLEREFIFNLCEVLNRQKLQLRSECVLRQSCWINFLCRGRIELVLFDVTFQQFTLQMSSEEGVHVTHNSIIIPVHMCVV